LFLVPTFICQIDGFVSIITVPFVVVLAALQQQQQKQQQQFNKKNIKIKTHSQNILLENSYTPAVITLNPIFSDFIFSFRSCTKFLLVLVVHVILAGMLVLQPTD
jgi:hypothetical protein